MSLPAAAIWLAFLLCLTLAGLAGPVPSLNGGVIAVETNLSGGWISFGLFTTYLLNTYMLYLHGAH